MDDADLAAHAALDGVGVAYLLADHVAPLIFQGRLVSLLEGWAPPPAEFFLYYPSRRQMPAALRAFIDFLRAEFADVG